jgi:predicted TIM-barrel fold metal-dependent hydrolase
LNKVAGRGFEVYLLGVLALVEATVQFEIIDADAHHLDGAAYKSYLPERYRIRSGPYFPSFGWDIYLNGTTGRKPADPDEYCKDLDQEIGDAVAYPSNALSIGFVRELDLAAELAKAYNNWAADFCKSTSNRVKYAAVIAPQVVSEAVKEIRRAVTQLGAVGVMMPSYVLGGMDLGQPQFDPIYAEAQELAFRLDFMPRRKPPWEIPDSTSIWAYT